MVGEGVIGPEIYAGWGASELGQLTEHIEDRLLFDLLGDVSGRRVLDVGCGEGNLAIKLQRRGASVVGVDPNPRMIDQARSRARVAGADCRFLVATGARLPFPEAVFDAVLAKTVLCFVPDAGPMFTDMARVLRPGGRFVIGELGKWSSWAAQRRLRAWMGSQLWQRARFRTERELRALSSAAWLDVRTVRGAIFYPRSLCAARLMAPIDSWCGRRTRLGAAFIALLAEKPG